MTPPPELAAERSTAETRNGRRAQRARKNLTQVRVQRVRARHPSTGQDMALHRLADSLAIENVKQSHGERRNFENVQEWLMEKVL